MARSKTSMMHLRLIAFVTADIFLLSCCLTAFFLPYIPIQNDVLGLASHYQVYLQIASFISCIALFGVYRQSAFLIQLYATFLFVDLAIAALPRALLITSIFSAPSQELLNSMSQNLPPTLITSSIADPSGIPLLDALVTDGVVCVSAWWGDVTEGMSERNYKIFATFLKLGLVVVLGLLSVAQAAAAGCVRKYGLRLKRGEAARRIGVAVEELYHDEEFEPKSIIEEIVVDLDGKSD